jgi:hypothetical protein
MSIAALDPTIPRVLNVLIMDSEGKRIAVKYYSPEWCVFFGRERRTEGAPSLFPARGVPPSLSPWPLQSHVWPLVMVARAACTTVKRAHTLTSNGARPPSFARAPSPSSFLLAQPPTRAPPPKPKKRQQQGQRRGPGQL